MFSGALSYSQDLCSWGEIVPLTAAVDGMFTFTNCPDDSDPDLALNPPGPFCFECLPAAPSTKGPASAPSLVPSLKPSGAGPSLEPTPAGSTSEPSPGGSTNSPSVLVCEQEAGDFDFCIENSANPDASQCENCVTSYWPTNVSSCSDIDDETCLGIDQCAMCDGCDTELLVYVSCLSKCDLSCSPTPPTSTAPAPKPTGKPNLLPTGKPTRKPTDKPVHKPTGKPVHPPSTVNNGLVQRCFDRIKRRCNCGLVRRGSKCHVKVSRRCQTPSRSSVGRRKFVQKVRNRYKRWCRKP